MVIYRKMRYKHLIITILMFIGVLAIVSSASGCLIPHHFDEGHKTFKTQNKNYKVYWSAYKYDINDNVMVDKKYIIKNKKGKTLYYSTAHYKIEKIKKNRIKLTTSYSTGPPKDKVKIYKSKLTVKNFYFRLVKFQFKKLDKRIYSKETVIDQGNFNTTLPYNGSYKHLSFYSKENITSVDHTLSWKTKTYTVFRNIISISQEYSDTAPKLTIIGGGSFEPDVYGSFISLEKIKKNQIKITFSNIRKLNGDLIKNKSYKVNTNLSLRKYYFDVFKPKMVKIFSLNG